MSTMLGLFAAVLALVLVSGGVILPPRRSEIEAPEPVAVEPDARRAVG